MKKYFLIFFFSIIAIFIHGYQFAYSDQEIFIPYILRSADQSLFPQDQIFNQSSAHLSLFYPLAGFMTKLLDIETIFFTGYLIFQFSFFVAIYRLSKVLLSDQYLAYFSLLPFMLPKFIGGTATQTFDLFFGYRSIGVVLLILYLSFLIEKKYLKSGFLAVVALLFHPLSAIPGIFSIPAVFILNAKVKLLSLSKFIALLLVLFLIIVLIGQRNIISSLLLRDESWISIMKFRADYLFTSTWKLSAWGAFFMYFVICVIFLNLLKKGVKKSVIIISSTAIIIFLINTVLLEWIKLPGFAKPQLIRSIAPVAYMALSLSPLFLTYKDKILKTLGIVTFTFLCLNLFYYFSISAILFIITFSIVKNKSTLVPSKHFVYLITALILSTYIILNYGAYLNLQSKIQFPKKENDWINLQKWANQNTQKSATFLVPPKETGFRIFSHRPIVGDSKDGAVVIYNPQYASYWSNLMKDLSNYEDLNEQEFSLLKKKYSFNYLITKTNQIVNLEIIYKNKSYILYKI